MGRGPEKPCLSPLTALDAVGTIIAVANGGDHVTLALGPVRIQPRGALRNVKIVDLSSRDIVYKA